MFNINFLEKDLRLVAPPHIVYDFQESYFSFCILFTDQVSLSDCLYFLRYYKIFILQLFVNQAVKSRNLKLKLSFYLSRFAT